MINKPTAWVITVSDRASAGIYTDQSGPILKQGLIAAGFDVQETRLIPDEFDAIQEQISLAIEAKAKLIVTTGGTGVSPRDITPEATAPFINKLLPGISEALRATGYEKNPKASLSRGLAGISGEAIIINLPGSPNGVRDGLMVIKEVINHLLEQLNGDEHAN